MAERRRYCMLGCAGALAFTAQAAVAGNGVLRVKVVDEATGNPVPRAMVVLDDQVKRSTFNGVVRFGDVEDDRVTLTAIYDAGSVKRLVTFHDVPVDSGRPMVLPVENGRALRREARFAMSVPFVPDGTDWTGLLPQLGVQFAGPKLGIFDGIELFEDKLQDDGLASVMVVAFDGEGLPFQYGYVLDQSPGLMDGKFLFLAPPLGAPIVNPVAAVSWTKAADPINDSNPEENCEFTVPPYTTCGVANSVDGIFSWLNVKRKGVTYSAPGAFLPTRTAGANPWLALPDSIVELVGHDDPLGMFGGENYSRFKYLRFETVPVETTIRMPNVLIGDANETGAQAIDVAELDDTLTVRWTITAMGDESDDVSAVDYGTAELIWQNDGASGNTIWRHWFAPAQGDNVLTLPVLPDTVAGLMPAGAQVFNDVTVTVFGSDGVDGFDGAWDAWQSGEDPLQLGEDAFNVLRWR